MVDGLSSPTEGSPTDRVRREYELSTEPESYVWDSWTVRENLASIIDRELLGPAHGDDELLDAQPDGLYLVGRIAPAKLVGRGAVTSAGAEDSDSDVDSADQAGEGRGVPVPGVDEDPASADDDGVEDAPIRKGLMIPASMGLRFQVLRAQASVTIRASWGQYKPETADEPDAAGRQRRRYRRTPIDHARIVPVGSLTPGTTHDVVLQDDVTLRVDVMDDGERRIVEVALCNDRETPRQIPVDAWMYQTRLYVEADGEDVFLPVTDALEDTRLDAETEVARLQLQYRNRLEFAIGRTCSADWTVAPGARRATQVRTTWMPVSETPQTQAREIEGALLDMLRLASADVAELDAGLRPIVTGYRAWLDHQATVASQLPAHLRTVAEDAVHEARNVAKQLESGLDFLLQDAEALRCFRFMNQVMADQRIQSQVAARRAADPDLEIDAACEVVLTQGARAHSWRTFQIAFVLMQLEALANPTIKRRSSEMPKAELLFFPTGGGKTEAYLGLAAFTFAIRRRQGLIAGADGAIDGRSGVAVLMRYTLRLLTAQQFQRATALVCAAEVQRRADEETWGTEPFRIGLWVGTSVSPKRYPEAEQQLLDAAEGKKYGLTVLQLQRCPWCGTPIDASKHVRGDKADRRIRVYCGSSFGECPFSLGAPDSDDEGLPVLTVDEEIYRLTPSFVIATVDKFARLAREGEAAALFGYVRTRCERHGYVHEDFDGCDLKSGGIHPAKDGHGSARVRNVDRLRPPDLIIQDELHLITGALGTAVGAFEMAIDVLTTWKDADGATVRPLVVASTATVRNAKDQIRALYGRKVTMFPTQVLDVADTFFSSELPVTRETPGRRYVGISTTGVRLTAAEIVVASSLLSAGQLLIDRAGVAADPYMTMVGYFNATRELAGMARYVADDVQTAIQKRRAGKYFPLRYGTDFNALNVAELTSRVASTEITTTLDEMAVPFDPEFDSTDGRRTRGERRKAGETLEQRAVNPFDVVLATSMLQVGVDVTRLGLMLMVGQPKNTAEYIQASSRVGRDASRPGLVVTLGNWARPRDLAHFEQFRHYHETFYSQVEPLSVTPYSLTSIDRSLDGVLISAARVLEAARESGLSPERAAGRITDARPRIESLAAAIVERAKVAGGEDAAHAVSERLANRLDQWEKRRSVVAQKQHRLVYERVRKEGEESPLLLSPENARVDTPGIDSIPFVVANSMREVQPEINILVTPLKEKLMAYEVMSGAAPAWQVAPERRADAGEDGDD
ncbi:helicase domain protein [Xylanimonas cellulosilytica DSM 15894]|uniref:Helicase domain protein n=1 Tax=Xylanimonas cellulosilytica (strain DSM 15894 / JCM 12276 / CECT 5975 / KCTC 9989 / LMG 20990 / NBRC 107835 / XIL07) TaxID=446471 RepID=D1BVM0_XYLCX|nr:DISARM system helicase DrmA [Xylanimonas cellulosilytica]ACZ31339.1 helicase domain protein [Xylanimonas cellulosilytica DSM 15894]